MINRSLPTVLIDNDSWQRIVYEVSYWAKLGYQQGQAPFEAVFYPLVSIKLRDEQISTPFDTIELDHVDKFIVSEIFIPHRKYADYSPVSAKFTAPKGKIGEMQRDFEKGITKIQRRLPHLICLAPGHSHPFAIGTTSPSHTDIEHHIRPYRHKNNQLLGYNFSLALIVAQSNDRQSWIACAFAMDGNDKIHSLGTATIVNKGKHLRLAKSRPFYHTSRGKRWEWETRYSLEDRLIEHERWPGGWTTFLIKEAGDQARLIMLPPHFPSEPPLEQRISLKNREASNANRLNFGRAYKYYQLSGDLK